MGQYIYKNQIQSFSFQNVKGFASPITILYGGKTGNSAFIANEIYTEFKKYELDPTVISMDQYDFSNLEDEKYLFIVVSTRGEGDPPGQAKAFYKHLFGKNAPKLPNLNYSVCALGDSTYQFFCQTGKDIDRQLEKLGASRYVSLVTCDLAYKSKSEFWASSLLNKFQNRLNGDVVNLKFGTHSLGPTYTVNVKDKYRLTSEESLSEISHLVLHTDHPDFTYKAGDSVSIKPKNPYSLVVKIMIKQGYSHETIVKYKGKKKSIEELLVTKLELTCLSESVLCDYLAHTNNIDLRILCENKNELFKYLQFADVYDMLSDYPSKIEAQDLCQILNKIKRREYSISSSVSETPNEVHLTVKQFNYSAFGRNRVGACSSYINKGLQEGSSLKVQLIPNEEFRLPEDDLPVIMIGAGTGIAPFLSFLKERKAKEGNGDNWLIFGEKNRAYDFLYRKELEGFKEEGLLDHLDLAFSRDQEEKYYVQNVLKEKAKTICAWLNRGAHLYICGSMAMGKSVNKVLVQILQNHNKIDKEEVLDYLEKLKEDFRLHEDLY